MGVSAAGLLKTPALRGTMRDVQTDERVSYSFDINAASVDQLLGWVYPALYPVHDPAGNWGTPDNQGRRVTPARPQKFVLQRFSKPYPVP